MEWQVNLFERLGNLAWRISFVAVFAALMTLTRSSLADDKPIDEKPSKPPQQATEAETRSFQSAADYSKKAHGLSVLVMRQGDIIFESYVNGHAAEVPYLLSSGTKSFCGVLAICAAEDKLLDLDEKVSDTITEWQSDSRKSRITVRQLLNLTSGLAGGNVSRIPSYKDSIKEAKATAEPGEKFQYGPVPYQVFGELLTRKLAAKPEQETVHDYLHRRILTPIDLKPQAWRKGIDGNPNLPTGAMLTARDWAKFGELICSHGKWNGQQIVSSELLKECFVGTKVNPAYGLSFWLNKKGGPTTVITDLELIQQSSQAETPVGPSDMVIAAGLGKQRCYIIPSRNLVVIRQGSSSGREFVDAEFIEKLLPEK